MRPAEVPATSAPLLGVREKDAFWVLRVGGVFSTREGLIQCHQCPAAAAAAKSLQSCLTLWDPIDGGPPGSSVPGILQARTLEWVAISFSNA